MTSYQKIEEISNITPQEFFERYVGKKPLVLRGFLKDWSAIEKWNENYFLNLAGEEKVKIKVGNTIHKENKLIYLRDYITSLLNKEKMAGEQLYLHDIPMLTILPTLKDDLNPFPLSFLSKWYRYKWWRNILFFYGAPGAVTAMHFDNLGTHNLFFHIRGKKRFIIIEPEDEKYCYLSKCNSYLVDPENPCFDKYPLFKNAKPSEVTLLPGDALYMPPFTLHHVRSIDLCMSMNIDWHTKKSVMAAIFKLFKRKRYSRVSYNLVCMLGVVFKIPSKFLHPIYKYYLRNG